MQTDGSGTLSFATASGGGGGSGGPPSGSTMITGVNKTVYSDAPSVRLTADSSSDTTFYVCGGAQYRYASGSSATNSGLRYTPEMTNPSGIVAGWGLINQGGNNKGVGEDMNYTFVWDDGNNRFTGFPTGSTYESATGELGWGEGTTSYTSGGVTRYPWSYRYSSTSSWTNINFAMFVNGSIIMSVTVKADEVVDFMMRENYSLPSPAPQARMFASKLTYQGHLMTDILLTNKMRHVAEKPEKDGYFALEATELLNQAANEIDKLRGDKALLEIQLEYAKKHTGDKNV